MDIVVPEGNLNCFLIMTTYICRNVPTVLSLTTLLLQTFKTEPETRKAEIRSWRFPKVASNPTKSVSTLWKVDV